MTDSSQLVHRAMDLSDAEDYAAAFDVLTQAIRMDPGNAQTYFERGMVLMNLGQDAEAIPDFDRALAIDSEASRKVILLTCYFDSARIRRLRCSWR